MPAISAHYLFGQKVLSKLPKHISKTILSQKAAYDMGLQGPDILFYYHPLSKNPVSDYGHKLHSLNAKEFFENACNCIEKTNNDIHLAYIYGFICHFILDSECHPYIGTVVGSTAISHGELETAFDRLLLLKRTKKPHCFKRFEAINPNSVIAEGIAPFYPQVSPEEVNKSIHSIRFYTRLLCSPLGVKYTLMRLGESVIGKSGAFSGMSVQNKTYARCDSYVKEIHRLYTEAVDIAVDNIEDFYKVLFSGESLSERLFRDFN